MAGTNDTKDTRNALPKENSSTVKNTDLMEEMAQTVGSLTDNMNQFGKSVDSSRKTMRQFGDIIGGLDKTMNTFGSQIEKLSNNIIEPTKKKQSAINDIPASAKTGGTSATREVAKETRIQSAKLDDFVNRIQPQQQREAYIPQSKFDRPTVAPSDYRYKTAEGTRPHLGGGVGKGLGSDFNKNLLQFGHMLSPASFGTYAMMFGVGFPMQLKMAETITRPVTDVAEKYEVGRNFASGLTGIGDAMTGFQQQMSQSPFQMYESLYQSKILLSSALGGERQSNKAISTALDMAREYPVKTEQVLSSLSRLSVYPQVKPHLQDGDFQKKLMESVSGLSLIVPEQGMEGAMFSLVEAMSGS
jgi:hypothetical protein